MSLRKSESQKDGAGALEESVSAASHRFSEEAARPLAVTTFLRALPILLYVPLGILIAWHLKVFRSDPHPLVFTPLILPVLPLLLQPSRRTFVFTGIVVLEILCGGLAYHTIGEIVSQFVLVNIFLLNAIPTVSLCFRSKKMSTAGIVIASAAAVFVVPQHAWLGWRWIAVHAEAERVVQWAEESCRVSGVYPEDLKDYSHARSWTARYIHYGQSAVGYPPPFYLSYYVGTTSTSHTYMGNGDWFYYPD